VKRLCAAALALSFALLAAAPRGIDDALVAAAKKEGAVVLYGSMATQQMHDLVQQFQAKYGIPVETLRMESNALPGRLLTEARAQTYKADVVDEPGFQIDQLKRQNLLEQYRPPELGELTAGTCDRDGYWAAMFLNTETLAYNPDRLKGTKLTAPKTWQDLTRPEWRGQFALFNGSYEWYAAMLKAFGRDRGQALMRAYAANQPRMINSHQLAEDMLGNGEYAASLNTYGYDIARDQAKGRPVRLVNPNPTVVEVHAIAIVSHAPHPNAARLFERWLLSHETQQWVASNAGLGRISPRKDVKNNPAIWNSQLHYLISDPGESTHYADYAREFNEIFHVAG
jgi:iron(III) transport system substrate-binding protein